LHLSFSRKSVSFHIHQTHLIALLAVVHLLLRKKTTTQTNPVDALFLFSSAEITKSVHTLCQAPLLIQGSRCDRGEGCVCVCVCARACACSWNVKHASQSVVCFQARIHSLRPMLKKFVTLRSWRTTAPSTYINSSIVARLVPLLLGPFRWKALKRCLVNSV